MKEYDMKNTVNILSLCLCFILSITSLSVPREWGNPESYTPGHRHGDESPSFTSKDYSYPHTPPPYGEPSLICEGIDIGNPSGGPNNYPNARHVIHHPEGQPWVNWEWGSSRNNNLNVSHWHIWNEWDSPVVISDQDIDAGRCAMAVDSKGNIHVAWHQTDDGGIYYIRYAKRLNGSKRWIHNAEFCSYDNCAFPSIVVDFLDNPWIIYYEGEIDEQNDIKIAHSLNCGETWEEIETVPEGPYQCTWMLPTIDIGGNGSIHAQFMGNGINVYYSCRDPFTGLWSPGEIAAHGENGRPLYTATMIVDSEGVVHMAGFQDYGESSTNYGNVGVIKYWYGRAGNWSEPDAPFCECAARVDSFASYPTLGIDDQDNLDITFARADTLIDDQPVSGIFYSSFPAGADGWTPQENLLVPDEYDCIYPQLTMRVSTEGSLPGPGILWSEMIDASPPSSVYYMWLGSRDDLPPVTIETLDTPTTACRRSFAAGSLYVIENSGREQVLDLWLHITGEPLGKPCQVLLLEDFTIPADFKGEVTVRHWVPGRAPLGPYHVTCMIGHFPDDPLDATSFWGAVIR